MKIKYIDWNYVWFVAYGAYALLDNWFGFTKFLLEKIGIFENTSPLIFHTRLISACIFIWLILMAAPVWIRVLKDKFVKEEFRPQLTPSEHAKEKQKTWSYLAFAGVILAIVFSFNALPTLLSYFQGINVILSWNILNQYAGQEAPSGRKEIIEEFVSQDRDLRKINIQNAWLEGLRAKGGNFTASNMINAHLSNSDFQKAKLNGSTFSGATLAGVDFTDADLRDAIIGKTNVSYGQQLLPNGKMADIQGIVDGADLKDAKLTGADLKSAIMFCVKNLTCAQLSSAKNWASTYRDKTMACNAEIPEWDGWKGKAPKKIVCSETTDNDKSSSKTKKSNN